MVDVERGGYRNQGEGVRSAVADLAIAGIRCDRKRRQFNRGDQLVLRKLCLELRRVSRELMEVGERDAPYSANALHFDECVKRGERHAHIGRVGGDAVVTRSENGSRAIEPFESVATGAGLTLIAARSGVIEVRATSALEQVAANGGHISQLAGGAGEERLGEHRIARADQWMRGEMTVPYERADAHAAVGQLVDINQWEPADVDHHVGALDVFTHQVDQIRTATEEPRMRVRRDRI